MREDRAEATTTLGAVESWRGMPEDEEAAEAVGAVRIPKAPKAPRRREGARRGSEVLTSS